MIKRQKDEMTRLICESNAFFVRAKKEALGNDENQQNQDLPLE